MGFVVPQKPECWAQTRVLSCTWVSRGKPPRSAGTRAETRDRTRARGRGLS